MRSLRDTTGRVNVHRELPDTLQYEGSVADSRHMINKLSVRAQLWLVIKKDSMVGSCNAVRPSAQAQSGLTSYA